MKVPAMNSRVPDVTFVGAGVTWLGTHLAQVNLTIQIIAGGATIIAMIYAARYHSLKRRALERMVNGGPRP